MKKPKAPVIQESAAEKTLRANGSAMATEAQSITDRLAGRANKMASADTSHVVTGAANASAARATGQALRESSTVNERLAAVLGGESARLDATTNAHASSMANRVENMAGQAKRGAGITGSVLSALSTQADGQARAAEITTQAKMQRQAAKMKAISGMANAAVSYQSNMKMMNELRGINTDAKAGDFSPVQDTYSIKSRLGIRG